MISTHSKKLATPAEVASHLGVSPITVRSWAEKGWITPKITPGGHRHYLWEDVERILSNRAAQTTPRHAPKILIVDDDKHFRAYLNDAISTLMPDSPITEAIDGFQAGMATMDFRPDIIFLDYKMPGMDGATVCSQIRMDARLKWVKIFAVTGLLDPDIEHAFLSAGADKVLFKPLSLATLAENLAQYDVDLRNQLQAPD